MKNIIYLCLLLLYSAEKGATLSCVECNSWEEQVCGEYLPDNHGLVPTNCEDTLGIPRYCVKQSGVIEGVIGTSRFCSAVDLGNQCDIRQRAGDDRDFFGCMYTCSTDGCNAGDRFSVSLVGLLLAGISVVLLSM